MLKTEQNSLIRDTGPYSGRNSAYGSLIKDTQAVLNALASESSFEQVRKDTLHGKIISQKTRPSRKRVWNTIYRRFFTHQAQWVVNDLKLAYSFGAHSPEFISMVYTHYCLSDKLTFDFITNIVWDNWMTNQYRITRDDFLAFLEDASDNQQQINKWSPVTRGNLASNNLSAFRDFGLLKGKTQKDITQPALPMHTVQHVLRILILEGKRGKDVLTDSTWRLFLRTPNEISGLLGKLSQTNIIRYEKVGNIVVLETPEEWETAQ